MSKKCISIDIPVEDAMDMVSTQIGDDGILDRIDKNTIHTYISINEFISYHGASEILSYIDDSDIEDEFQKRSPLGVAFE